MFGKVPFTQKAFYAYCDEHINRGFYSHGFRNKLWSDVEGLRPHVQKNYARFTLLLDLRIKAKQGKIVSQNGYFNEEAAREYIKRTYRNHSKHHGFSHDTTFEDVQNESYNRRCMFWTFDVIRDLMNEYFKGTLNEVIRELQAEQQLARSVA